MLLTYFKSMRQNLDAKTLKFCSHTPHRLYNETRRRSLQSALLEIKPNRCHLFKFLDLLPSTRGLIVKHLKLNLKLGKVNYISHVVACPILTNPPF